MALDQNYFDSINIDLVKKKYYNANKVEAVLSDIKTQALSMASDNASLRSELNAKNSKAYEVGDAILSANALARRIVDDAKKEAATIIENAEKRAAAIEKEAEERCNKLCAASEESRELVISRVEASFSRMREQNLASIEMINEDWRSLLCELYEDTEDAAEGKKPYEVSPAEPSEDTVPELSDIDAKISAILQDINEIDRDK